MKKAQGLSMNVIIIAALALIVLVILAVVFMGRMGVWGIETNTTNITEEKDLTFYWGYHNETEKKLYAPIFVCNETTTDCYILIEHASLTYNVGVCTELTNKTDYTLIGCLT